MPKKPDQPNKPASRRLSLAPLTPDQALAAALQVKKTDVDKLAKEDKAKKKQKGDKGQGKG